MSFLGVFEFNAPYLPWVMVGMSLLFSEHLPMQDLVGIALGHVYYFLDDVYPITSGTGKQYLRAPAILKRLVDGVPRRHDGDVHLPETEDVDQHQPVENEREPLLRPHHE
jgi:hypothetical protein